MLNVSPATIETSTNAFFCIWQAHAQLTLAKRREASDCHRCSAAAAGEPF